MKNQSVRVLDARPVTKEIISAKDFVRLSEMEQQKIKGVEIVPPRLGGHGFGGIRVDYKTPVYKVFQVSADKQGNTNNKGMVPADPAETLTKVLEVQVQDIALKSEQLEVEKQRIEIDKQKKVFINI